MSGRDDMAELHPMVAAQRAMERGERLIWAERPVAPPRGRGNAPRFMFGLVYAGFALVWMAMAAGITGGWPPRWTGAWPPEDWLALLFPLFGIPFFVVGLIVAFSSFRAPVRQPLYAISNRRVLVLSGKDGTVARSLPFAAIGKLDVTARPDGSGDVAFRDTPADATGPAGFYGVAHARAVAAEIEAQQRRLAADLRGVPES